MNDENKPDIEQVIARFLDGEPEPEDLETLAAAMASDEGISRKLAEMLEIDDWLRQSTQPDDRAFVESIAMRLHPDAADDAFLRRFRRHRRWAKGGGMRRVLEIAAIVLVGVTLSLFLAGRYRRKVEMPQPRSIPAVDLADQDPSGQTDRPAAVLTRMVDVRWESADFSIDEGSALAPSRLRLTQGLVQIEFVSGAAVVLEGPCDFELLSPDRAVCRRGKVRAHVPPSASGFSITAPGVNAIDLGTEFAIKIDETGQGQVHVIDGAVELRGAGDHPQIQGVRTLKAGQGIDFGSGKGLRDLVADPAAFVDRFRLLQLENDHQRQRYRAWLTHSQALRTDPDLLLYYTFDETNTWERLVRNVATSQPDGSRDGTVVGCLPCAGRWPEKSALEFKRISDRVRINVPGEFDRLSMAAWVRIEGLNHWLSALMLTDGWDLGEGHWQITADGQLGFGANLPNHRPDDGHLSPPILGPEDLGRWVYLATVYDKQTNLVVHYLDGRRVSQGPFRVPTTLRIGPAEIGNWSPYPLIPKKRNLTRSLNGRIDEFAIWQRALTDEEVRRMYELGRPSS